MEGESSFVSLAAYVSGSERDSKGAYHIVKERGVLTVLGKGNVLIFI